MNISTASPSAALLEVSRSRLSRPRSAVGLRSLVGRRRKENRRTLQHSGNRRALYVTRGRNYIQGDYARPAPQVRSLDGLLLRGRLRQYRGPRFRGRATVLGCCWRGKASLYPPGSSHAGSCPKALLEFWSRALRPERQKPTSTSCSGRGVTRCRTRSRLTIHTSDWRGTTAHGRRLDARP
jgi:hypothetical protein